MRSGAAAEEDVERGRGGRDTSCYLRETNGTQILAIKRESARTAQGPSDGRFGAKALWTRQSTATILIEHGLFCEYLAEERERVTQGN